MWILSADQVEVMLGPPLVPSDFSHVLHFFTITNPSTDPYMPQVTITVNQGTGCWKELSIPQ